MANTDPIEFILYSADMVTEQAILPVASGHIYLEFQEPGSGEVRIPLDSSAAALVSNGMFVKANYRGAARFGFFVDNIKQTEADANEGGGRWLSISGRGPLAILDDGIVWDNGSGSTTRAFTSQKKGAILKTLIDEAVTRGALSTLDYDFTATVDSSSVAWTDSEDYDINVGQSLLDVLRMFAQTGDMEFAVTLQAGAQPILLSAYKNGTGTDRSSTVYMRIGSNCEEVTTDERGDEIKNAYLIKYKDGYAKVSDATSISARRRREEFLSLEAAQSGTSATTYASAKLDGTKDPKQSISVRVYDGVTPYLFVNYDMGDTVTVDKFGTQVSKRILGIQADFDGFSWAHVVLEMNVLLYDNELRTKHELDWLMNQWNTAKDDNLTEIKQWLGFGSPNGTVYALHYYGGFLYVGGDFTSIAGRLTTTNIARYNVSTGGWQAMDAGITSGAVIAIAELAGDIYAATETKVYHWTAGSWSLIGTDTGPIKTMVSFDGSLYVGGVGLVFDSGGSAQAVMQWIGSAPWVASLAYPPTCFALAVYNGDLYGGFNTSTSNALRHLDSGAWSTVMATPTDGTTVKALVTAGSSLVYAGGAASTEKVYSWDGTSSTRTDLYSVTSWGDPGGGSHDALAAYLSDVYHGSVFTSVSGTSGFGNIARYSGGALMTMAGGVSTAVSDRINAIVVVGTDVYVGGTFSTAGGKPISNLAVWITTFQSLIDHLANGSSFDMGGAIHAATAITTPTDSDEFPLWEDTASDLRKVTWANIKSTLKTYFDTLYGLLASVNVWTRQQQIVNATNGEGAIYAETIGDAYTADIEQYTIGNNVTSPAMFLYRETSGTGNITSAFIEGQQTATGAGTITGGIIHFQTVGGTNLFDVLADGSLRLPQIADANAVNDSIYYSTTANKIVYKDSGGTVNALY